MVWSCALTDLCDPELPTSDNKPCWKIQAEDDSSSAGKFGQWNGRVVGVLGHLNRGKSWVLGRLSNCKFPTEGMANRTNGLSLKWIEIPNDKFKDEDPRQHVAIDTAGLGTPIKFDRTKSSTSSGNCKKSADDSQPNEMIKSYLDDATGKDEGQEENDQEEESMEKELEKANIRMRQRDDYEEFLVSMTLSLSNYIIVVMNETNLQEQRLLYNIVSRWRNYVSQDVSKDQNVYVVHNFRTSETTEEREAMFSRSTDYVWGGKLTPTDGISTFLCPSLKTCHVCLMNDSTPDGKVYNKKVFTLLKTWIHSLLPTLSETYTPNVMVRRFAKEATKVIKEKEYLTNFDRIEVEKDDGEYKYVPIKVNKDGKITLTDTANGK